MRLDTHRLQTLDQVREFLDGSERSTCDHKPATTPGEVRCLLAHLGLGGLHRKGDPDPVTVGSGPVPRFAVRLVALEAALWESGREAPTAAELAEEAGLELSSCRPSTGRSRSSAPGSRSTEPEVACAARR